MIGINIAGFLYNNGEGFRQGTIFYIVTIMLLGSATIMWFTSKYEKKTNTNAKKPIIRKLPEKDFADSGDGRGTYKWFLTSLIVIVIGAACVSQIFLIFLQDGLNMSSEEMASVLTAWTMGGMLTCLLCGWIADRIGRATVLIMGLIFNNNTFILWFSL